MLFLSILFILLIRSTLARDPFRDIIRLCIRRRLSINTRVSRVINTRVGHYVDVSSCLAHALTRLRAAVRAEQKRPAIVGFAGGQYHAFRHSETHFARCQIGHHDGQPAV